MKAQGLTADKNLITLPPPEDCQLGENWGYLSGEGRCFLIGSTWELRNSSVSLSSIYAMDNKLNMLKHR